MRSLLLCAAAAAAAAAMTSVTPVSASSSTTASRLDFAAPDQIATSGIAHRSALFGSSNFGDSNHLIGKLVPLTQEPGDSNRCPTAGPKGSSGAPTGVEILVLDGWPACAFTEEAMFAQSVVGAKGLIVLEDRCMRENKDKTQAFAVHCASLCPSGTPDEDCYLDKLNYMGGSSHEVHIPAMIVSRWDGLRAVECYLQQRGESTPQQSVTGVNCAAGGAPPLAELRWNIAQADRVDYELWTSSLLNADVFVQKVWATDVVPLIAARTVFTPRYFVWDGEQLACRHEAGQPLPPHCKDACHSLGRYCHYDPDGLDNPGVRGADLSRENLRQLCLFNNLRDAHVRSGGQQGDSGWPQIEQKWWRYTGAFAANCTDSYHADCSEKMHKALGLDWAATLKCVQSSGGYDDASGPNALLDTELALREDLEIQKLPTLIVNGKIIDFGASLKDVLAAICAGFRREARPGLCPCAMSSDPALYDNDNFGAACLRSQPPTPYSGSDGSSGGGGSSSDSGGVGLGLLLIILIGLVGCLLSVFAVYRQRERSQLRHEVHEDIRNIMGEYMRMGDNGSADPPAASSADMIGDPIGMDDDQGGRGGRRGDGGYERVVELN